MLYIQTDSYFKFHSNLLSSLLFLVKIYVFKIATILKKFKKKSSRVVGNSYIQIHFKFHLNPSNSF